MLIALTSNRAPHFENEALLGIFWTVVAACSEWAKRLMSDWGYQLGIDRVPEIGSV